MLRIPRSALARRATTLGAGVLLSALRAFRLPEAFVAKTEGLPDSRFAVAATVDAGYGLERSTLVKLLAFITGACMLLGTYALTALRRRLGGMLDRWGREPVDRWSPAMPTAPK